MAKTVPTAGFRTAIIAVAVAVLTQPACLARPAAAGEEPTREKRQLAWQDRFEREVRPALLRHCGDCHVGGDSESGFDLDAFPAGEDAAGQGPMWDRVARLIARGEMPPEGSEPLPEAVAISIADWAAQRPRQDNCQVIASDETANWYRGEVNGRRLTRAEYDNAVRELTTLDLRPSAGFPADACGGEGFDTHGSTLYSSPILAEQLLAAADRVIETAVPDTAEGLDEATRRARQTILTALPVTPDEEADAAREIVGTFATRAFRSPVQPHELDRLLTLYELGRASGEGFVAAVRTPLKAVLLSPRFLFVSGQFEGEGGISRLTDHQLAERLALFLWSGLPDAELRAVADAGTLSQEAVLSHQVRRMLADPRSAALAENFGLQWLGLTDLTHAVSPDAGLFPEYDADLAGAMSAEVVAMLVEVFSGGRPLTDLLEGERAFVNDRLAEHYGLTPVEGGEIRPVAAGGDRGGLLTTAAVLTATSYPHRTTPVGRGKWVLETLLGERMPPPPEGVATLDEHEGQQPATLRQRLQRHREDPACAACHSRMDPLGFALERFDAVGRYRSQADGVAIDDSGRLPGGRELNGAAELKSVLVERRADFYANVTRKLLGYGLGRGVNEFDECVIRRCATRLEETGGRFDELVIGVVTSYPFQHRYFKK